MNTKTPPTIRRWEAVVNFHQYHNSAPQAITYTGECRMGHEVALHDVFLELACRLALNNQDAASIDELEIHIHAPEPLNKAK